MPSSPNGPGSPPAPASRFPSPPPPRPCSPARKTSARSRPLPRFTADCSNRQALYVVCGRTAISATADPSPSITPSPSPSGAATRSGTCCRPRAGLTPANLIAYPIPTSSTPGGTPSPRTGTPSKTPTVAGCAAPTMKGKKASQSFGRAGRLWERRACPRINVGCTMCIILNPQAAPRAPSNTSASNGAHGARYAVDVGCTMCTIKRSRCRP